MTKSRSEPALQIAGAVLNATDILSRCVAELGGNYSAALVRIGTEQKKHNPQIAELAEIFANISHPHSRIECRREETIGVSVDEMCDWWETFKENFPETTTEDGYEVRRAGEQHPPARVASVAQRDITIANFGPYWPDTAWMLSWGRKRSLIPASPRAVFALGRHKPQLHVELNEKAVIIALPTVFVSSRLADNPMCCWWSAKGREIIPCRPGPGWHIHCWFPFVHE